MKHVHFPNFCLRGDDGLIRVYGVSCWLSGEHDVIVCTERKTPGARMPIQYAAVAVAEAVHAEWRRMVWIERVESCVLVGGRYAVKADYNVLTFKVDKESREIRGVESRPIEPGEWSELGVPKPDDIKGAVSSEGSVQTRDDGNEESGGGQVGK